MYFKNRAWWNSRKAWKIVKPKQAGQADIHKCIDTWDCFKQKKNEWVVVTWLHVYKARQDKTRQGKASQGKLKIQGDSD